MTRRRPDAILAFTDGACSGNPGPAGIGIVLVCGSHRKEISEYVGEATSNIAELRAVVRALSTIKDRDRFVILHTDSEYAIGALTKTWKIRANKHLIEQARALAATLPTYASSGFLAMPGSPRTSAVTCWHVQRSKLREVLPVPNTDR